MNAINPEPRDAVAVPGMERLLAMSLGDVLRMLPPTILAAHVAAPAATGEPVILPPDRTDNVVTVAFGAARDSAVDIEALADQPGDVPPMLPERDPTAAEGELDGMGNRLDGGAPEPAAVEPVPPAGSWELIEPDAVASALAVERDVKADVSEAEALFETFGSIFHVDGLGWFKATESFGKPFEISATVGRDAFADALAKLCRAVERRSTIPILGNVRLVASPGKLTMTTTDLDVEMVADLPCEADGTFATTVPAQLALDLAKRKRGGSVTLTAEARKRTFGSEESVSFANAALRFTAGTSQFSLVTLPAGDFPEMDAPDESFVWTMAIPAADLDAAFGKVEFAISSEETRYYLNGVYFHLHDKRTDAARMVATDGHRLSCFTLSGDRGGLADFPGAIIPRETVRLFRETFGKKPAKDAIVSVAFSASKVRLICGDMRITSKLIDGTFPDYYRVMPMDNDKIIRLDADTMMEAIDSVSVIASERGRAVKLAIEPGEIVLTVQNPDCGSASERMPCDYTGAPIEIGFNSGYLDEILAIFAPGKRKAGERRMVTMRLADAGAPALFEGASGPTCVLMPMRV